MKNAENINFDQIFIVSRNAVSTTRISDSGYKYYFIRDIFLTSLKPSVINL